MYNVVVVAVGLLTPRPRLVCLVCSFYQEGYEATTKQRVSAIDSPSDAL